VGVKPGIADSKLWVITTVPIIHLFLSPQSALGEHSAIHIIHLRLPIFVSIDPRISDFMEVLLLTEVSLRTSDFYTGGIIQIDEFIDSSDTSVTVTWLGTLFPTITTNYENN